MDTQVISTKRILNDKVVMTEPTMIFVKNIRIVKYHLVSDDDAMRVDKISKQYYGNVNHIDRILKWNGISNPFLIAPGMILEIPDLAGQTLKWMKPDAKENPIRQQFLDVKRMNKQDKTRAAFLKNRSAGKPNGSKENLPPNIIKSGETDIVIKDDVISLQASDMNTGINVVGDSLIVNDNMSAAEVKNAYLRNTLINKKNLSK
jgi:hypothetical protein